MSLELMYITNSPDVALIAQKSGVDRIFADLEFIGKNVRQAGMDTVKSRHNINDVKKFSKLLTSSRLLVRCNRWHEKGNGLKGSVREIEEIIDAGADYIMLPYFRTKEEVRLFSEAVGGRVKTVVLCETASAAGAISEIVRENIDEVHIGLNDLSIELGMNFMFEPLAYGIVDDICRKISVSGKPYGFGGIASVNNGLIAGRKIIAEHYRLGSKRAILSRSFCDTAKITDLCETERIFETGVREIRTYDKLLLTKDSNFFEENRRCVVSEVKAIAEKSGYSSADGRERNETAYNRSMEMQ